MSKQKTRTITMEVWRNSAIKIEVKIVGDPEKSDDVVALEVDFFLASRIFSQQVQSSRMKNKDEWAFAQGLRSNVRLEACEPSGNPDFLIEYNEDGGLTLEEIG